MSLPEFSVHIDEVEFARRMRKFDAAMMKCSRKNDGFSIPPSLNILWLSTDLANPNQTKIQDRIQEFLGINGYDVQFTQTNVQITMQNEVDLLFIDARNNDNTPYLVRTISMGFLGLVPKYEVLVYGIGRDEESPYQGDTSYPMVAGTDFLINAVCLIHGYIRSYNDPVVICSRPISMMLELEDKLLRSGIIKDGNANYASDKINAFLNLLNCRKHSGREVEWIATVLELLRHTRNALAHTPHPPRALSGAQSKIIKINFLSEKCDRRFEFPVVLNNQDTFIVQKRWLTQLTQVTLHWINEYLEKYPVQAKNPADRSEERLVARSTDPSSKEPARNVGSKPDSNRRTHDESGSYRK